MSRGKGAFPFSHQMRFEWVGLLTSKWNQAMCHNPNFVPFFVEKNCEICLNGSADQSRALQRSGNICIYFYSRFKSKHIYIISTFLGKRKIILEASCRSRSYRCWGHTFRCPVKELIPKPAVSKQSFQDASKQDEHSRGFSRRFRQLFGMGHCNDFNIPVYSFGKQSLTFLRL